MVSTEADAYISAPRHRSWLFEMKALCGDKAKTALELYRKGSKN